MDASDDDSRSGSEESEVPSLAYSICPSSGTASDEEQFAGCESCGDSADDAVASQSSDADDIEGAGAATPLAEEAAADAGPRCSTCTGMLDTVSTNDS